MVELLHNPNSNNIIPRRKSPKPEKAMSRLSLDDTKPAESKKVDQVTFDTTLRMNNHLKNFLKAMVILGDSPTQQKALKRLQDNYFESLTDSERDTLRMQIKTLERSDVVNYNR